MASNYPSDPNRASLGSPSTSESGASGTVPENSLPQGASQAVSTPISAPDMQQSSGPSHGNGNQRRLPPGTELSNGRYRLEQSIAAGGMGAVYRAIDLRFNRPCAVKEMLDDFSNEAERTQAVEWFTREATLLLDLNHPCIPRVRDFFMEGGRHYLVMDFIEGRTLAEVMEKEGNVPGLNGARGVSEARARSWAQQVCSVLNYLHRQIPPIIFRDLKPSNIMVTNRDEIKLIDFGIARTFQSQRQSTIIMTPGYAPPEQLLGMPEPRSDLFALGSTLHRVLTHHDAANNRPDLFSFPPIRTLRPDASPAFEQVIMKALALKVEQRWGSAAEMERAIINLPPITVRPPTTTIPSQGPAPQPPSGGNPPTPSGPQLGVNGPAGSLIRAAQDHVNAGRFDVAHGVVQQAYSVEPYNALVHKLFGQIFLRRQPPAPDLAMQALTRSSQLNPNDAETHKLLGDVWLYFRRQPATAITAYTQSLRLNPGDFEAHQRLAKCYEETGQFEPALREYQEAVRLAPAPRKPEMQYGYNSLGLLAWRAGNLTIAERAFVHALILNPADHQTRFFLSRVYEREGKLDEAYRECSYVVGAMPKNAEAQTMFQRLRTQLGR